MLDNVIFKYRYNEVELCAVAQPIIDNRTKKTRSFELLSRSASVDCMEFFFSRLSARDVTNISCIQMRYVSDMLSNWGGLVAHINIHYKTLFNAHFMKLAESIPRNRLAFEINGFEYGVEQLTKLKGAFRKIQSFGHEIWLDDHGVNNATIGLLLNLPWNGVKIDKEIVWRSSPKQLISLVHCCKCYASKVTLEGIEDEYLQDLSVYSGADFSQGYYWGLLNLPYNLIE